MTGSRQHTRPKSFLHPLYATISRRFENVCVPYHRFRLRKCIRDSTADDLAMVQTDLFLRTRYGLDRMRVYSCGLIRIGRRYLAHDTRAAVHSNGLFQSIVGETQYSRQHFIQSMYLSL